jgi:hypothetical protein
VCNELVTLSSRQLPAKIGIVIKLSFSGVGE